MVVWIRTILRQAEVQLWHGNGRRSGTYDYYMSEPIVEDDAKGVGPFLLAYTELLRYENK